MTGAYSESFNSFRYAAQRIIRKGRSDGVECRLPSRTGPACAARSRDAHDAANHVDGFEAGAKYTPEAHIDRWREKGRRDA
jgi:hypothetical protein